MASDKVRVQLDLYQYEVQALDALRDSCGLRSRAEAVRTSLAIIEWVQQQVQQGRKIMAVGDDDVAQLVVPGLTTSFRAE